MLIKKTNNYLVFKEDVLFDDFQTKLLACPL